MGKNQDAYETVVSTPSSETLPPYTRSWTAGSTASSPAIESPVVKPSEKSWMLKTQRSWDSTKSTLSETFEQQWPKVRRRIPARKHFYAISLLVVFGIVPMVVLGLYTPRGAQERELGDVDVKFGDSPFHNVFADKIISCASLGNQAQNSTIHGIENAFALDRTFGQYTFSQVKIIDVVWDILLGRTVQVIAWYIGYVVFSDALLRAIERHPASFQIFQRITLEGPSLMSLWTLLVELWNAKSKRTKALFLYIWTATSYIICVQMMLGAMTGYDSTSIAFVDLDGKGNIVPLNALERTTVAYGTWNETFPSPECLVGDWYLPFLRAWNARLNYCKCQLDNGTIREPTPGTLLSYSAYQDSYIRSPYGDYGEPKKQFCRFNFPGNTQTFREERTDTHDDSYGKEYPCASTWDITINNRTFEALDLKFSPEQLCYANRSYDYSLVFTNARCMPDTGNPSYQWGFSTMLSGLFIFIHFGWCVSMYVVWLDAQLGSTLVKQGYAMTPLRAAFAITAVAKQKVGVSAQGLVRADTREVEQELNGNWRSKRGGAEVEVELFSGEGEARRRVRRGGAEEGV